MFVRTHQLHVQSSANRHQYHQRRSISQQVPTRFSLNDRQDSFSLTGGQLQAEPCDRSPRTLKNAPPETRKTAFLRDQLLPPHVGRSDLIRCHSMISSGPLTGDFHRHNQETNDQDLGQLASSHEYHCSFNQFGPAEQINYSKGNLRDALDSCRFSEKNLTRYNELVPARLTPDLENNHLSVSILPTGKQKSCKISAKDELETNDTLNLDTFYNKVLNSVIYYIFLISRSLKSTIYKFILEKTSQIPQKASFVRKSRAKFEFLSSFFLNFVAYQLETFALIIRNSNVNLSENIRIQLVNKRTKSAIINKTDDRDLRRLNWRRRESQFNRSVEEMYGAAARLGRSPNHRFNEYRQAQSMQPHRISGRFSTFAIDRQVSDKQIQALRASKQRPASSGAFHSYKDRLSGSSLNHSEVNITSTCSLSRSQFNTAIQSAVVERSVALNGVASQQNNGQLLSSNQVVIESRPSQCSANISCRPRSLAFSGSISASFDTNKQGGNSEHCSNVTSLKPHLDGQYGSDTSNQTNVRYPPIAVKDTLERGRRSKTSDIYLSSPHNFIRSQQQINHQVYSEQDDQEELLYLIESAPNCLLPVVSNERSFAYQDNNKSAERNHHPHQHKHQSLISSDSEMICTDAYRKRVCGLQQRHQSVPPTMNRSRTTSVHLHNVSKTDDSPTKSSVDNKGLLKPMTEGGKSDRFDYTRPLSVVSSESRTRPTSSSSSKKSSTHSKLSLAGAKRRLGLKQKGLSSLSVQRSEEVAPFEVVHLMRQTTATSLNDFGAEYITHNLINRSQMALKNSSSCGLALDSRAGFECRLGEGQIVSRQALVSPYLGDIQLSLADNNGLLEVEIVRASGLHARPGSRSLPSPFVKVYLMRNKKCLAKFKTKSMKQTLDPLYQEKYIFHQDYADCVLQVIVWADYGKRAERKSLMGIVQIRLNRLDLSNLLIGWYQLFNVASIASSLLPPEALRQTMMPDDIGKAVKWRNF